MDHTELDQRLSRISTQWTMVFQAHAADHSVLSAAQQTLLQRYIGAVYRYLLGAVRDADVAEELSQEFALRFLRGDFHGANPEKGRFRNYLRTALIHLVHDYHRARKEAPRQIAGEVADHVGESEEDESQFLKSWREELLHRTWKALKQANQTYHRVLLFRVENPDLSSDMMADHLAQQLEKPLNGALIRKTLERAHKKFADLLVDEVATSLEAESLHEIEEELRQTDLLRYCRSALERRRPANPQAGE